MFVVRVPDFLRMAEAKPHQALRKEGLVVEYAEEQLGSALFVSHQWCAREHPDPQFAQLAVLRAFLRRAFKGEVEVHPDTFSIVVYKHKPDMKARALLELRTGCIWYDFFSVPQPVVPMACSSQHTNLQEDFGKAVMSIPAYVAKCRFFAVLAPPVTHADVKDLIVDYATWKQRGWCRFERAARILSPKETSMLLVERDDSAREVGAQDYLLDSVGEGAFTVESDRGMLAPVVASLLEAKLQSLLQQQDLYRYRRLLAMRTSILRGLGMAPHDCCASGFRVERVPGSEVDGFLHLYGFSSAADRSGGAEPILLAAAAGDLPVVRGLLERRACISARERRDDAEFVLVRGLGVLHLASSFGRQPALVSLLLQLRAELEARESTGATPLIWAAQGGSPEVVGALVDARANVGAAQRHGITALDVATMHGRPAAVARLLAAGASVAANAEGVYPLTIAAMFPVGPEVTRALLAAPAIDLDVRYVPGCSSPSYALLVALSLALLLRGSRCPLALLVSHLPGATPLGMAAVLGHVATGRVLVSAGADVFARNRRGKTAAELAELVGLSPANVAYFRGGPTRKAPPGGPVAVDVDAVKPDSCLSRDGPVSMCDAHLEEFN